MGRECRYCVDHVIGLVKILKEAEKLAKAKYVSECNSQIERAQDTVNELVSSGCLSKEVAGPLTDDLAEAFGNEEPIRKAATITSALLGYHYDLATDTANFCQLKHK